VRITAQLIRTGTGVIVWSDSYDREVTDVFLVQEDIATAIAKALSMSLGLAPGERLVSSRNVDPQSYEQFLRARPLTRARFTGVPEAIKILEPLVARNPVTRLGTLGLMLCMCRLSDPPTRYAEAPENWQFWPKAEVAARRAIQLDPNLADAILPWRVCKRFAEDRRGRRSHFKALRLIPQPRPLFLLDILSNVGLKKACDGTTDTRPRTLRADLE
jgi:hypothetical protein